MNANQVNQIIRQMLYNDTAEEFLTEYEDLKRNDLEGIEIDLLVQPNKVLALKEANYTDELENAYYYRWSNVDYPSFEVFIYDIIDDAYNCHMYDSANEDITSEYTPEEWLVAFYNM